MIYKQKLITLMTIFSFMSIGWGQDCVDGVEVELWGECYNIEETTLLFLENDGLTGEIPSSIGNLINLQYLFLSNNQLTGEIPSEIWELTNLTDMYLHSNQLTGEIPPEIGNLENLTTLYLSSNQLTGEIPSDIGQLTNLQQLRLNNNQFTGEIPSEIGNGTNLDKFYLFNNQFTTLPESICNLNINWNSYIDFLSGDNYICDDIPECIIDSEGFNYGYDWDLGEITYQPQNCDECPDSIEGDIDGDGEVTILDIVLIVNCILSNDCDECSDWNFDGNVDILDIILMINIILEP